MRERVIDGMFVVGICAQGAGLFLEFGAGWALLAVGTELAALGIWGAVRA